MWCLYDQKTKIQHFLMREDAEERISEIIGKENITLKVKPIDG